VPSVIYVPTVTALKSELGTALHACAHITGGGIVGNVSRILTNELDAIIDMESFETPEIFFEIQRRGHVHADEMVRVFNCGLGMVLAVDASAADAAVSLARATGVTAMVVGALKPGTGKVVLS
jgi:phosphoribosylformylglycinamidine cyclo-ligase